jgi:uncharacterized protein YjbI with pentapeptide repeats
MPEQSQDGGAEEADTADGGSEDAPVAATSVDPIEAPVVPTEAQAKAVESFLATANSVAQRIQALWISFISFGAFLTITVLETTHLKLFLSDAVKLPFFNIDLPLTNFYFAAPAFFLIFHFYFLTQLILLTRTADAFETALDHVPPVDRDAVRMRLDNSIFLQMIAGAEPERAGRNAWFIRLSAWLTVIWLPLSLLLLIQLQFLPYHHDWLTTFHRCALSLDLLLLWMLWPIFRRGRGLWSLGLYVRMSGKPTARACLGLCLRTMPGLLLLTVVWFVIVYPGEPLYTNWLTRLPATAVAAFGEKSPVSSWILAWRVEPEKVRGARSRKPIETFSFTEILLEPRVDYVVGVPRGFFSNTLVLPDKKFAEDKLVRELDEVEKDLNPGEFKILPSLSFRGRNFAQAILPRTDLRRSDFTGAILNGANFESALLQKSRFGCADRGPGRISKSKTNVAVADPEDDAEDASDGSLGCAQLNQTRLDGAHLQSSDLTGAELQRASFFRSELAGAVLDHAKAQGANFAFARMIAASLASAKLDGASFSRARLQNAILSEAELPGASLSGAYAYGATFDASDLRGAILTNAKLAAASFNGAKLQGAKLVRAGLYGADFDDAVLDLATFEGAKLWRVASNPKSAENVMLKDIDVVGRPYEAGGFDRWRHDILETVSDADAREGLKTTLASLGPKAVEKSSASHDVWPRPVKKPQAAKAQASDAAQADEQLRLAAERQDKLAKFMADLACDAKGAPFVARRLILTRQFAEAALGLKEIANRLLAANSKDCPGGVGLTSSDLSNLRVQVK